MCGIPSKTRPRREFFVTILELLHELGLRLDGAREYELELARASRIPRKGRFCCEALAEIPGRCHRWSWGNF
jgi:hypothetical protein